MAPRFRFFALTIVWLTGAVLVLQPMAALAEPSPVAIAQLLTDHRAKNGELEFARLKSEGSERLQRLVRELESITSGSWERFTTEERQAFYMNAHLVLVLWQVVRNYPVDGNRIRFFPKNSVQQIEGFWTERYYVNGELHSLRSLEEKLLAEYGPLSVLPLYIAGRGGPPAPMDAWRANFLERQIRERLTDYFSSARGADADSQGRELRLSSLVVDFWAEPLSRTAAQQPSLAAQERFEEYAPGEALLLGYLEPYLPRTFIAKAKSRHYPIVRIPFDWSLPDASVKEAPHGIPLDPLKDFQSWEPGEPLPQPTTHFPRLPGKKDREPDEIKPLFED